MKFIKVLLLAFCLAPVGAFGASNDFMMAAQLLAAAKSADIQQVQILVNNGADVNFIDSTGLSIVCTALLNNDVRAAQILQMYGADASKCDNQIKRYNNKTKPKEGGGLFSGLSSAQSITLTAAGAAVVVGGLLLLTDVFDPGNGNDSSSGGGNRPNNNGNDSGGGATVTAAFSVPYGPAMPTATDETENFATNLNFYSPGNDSVIAKNFELMTDADGQNYLLMMNGYAPLARGYMGMRTLRNASTHKPLNITSVNWFSEPVMGGQPVNVALVTKNGVNANNYAYGVDPVSSLGDILLPWTTTNGTEVSKTDSTMVSSKYYNNKVVLGSGDNTVSDAVTVEDENALANFDLAGWGTAVNNPNATNDDNLLAKVVGGRVSGYADADYVGFMPNGQMTIFRTGDGMQMADVTPTESGSFVRTDENLTQIVLFGETLTVVQTGNSFVATNASGTKKFNGYIGTNGLLYIDGEGDGVINQAYSMSDDGVLSLVKQATVSDYLNYRALAKAVQMHQAGDLVGGRSRVDVIANASVIEPLREKTVEVIEDVLSLDSTEAKQSGLVALVNKYYNNVDEVDTNGNSLPIYPGTDAANVFSQLGAGFRPLVLFSTGAFETDANYTGRTYSATFENAVPLAFENAEHYFMSIVAVGLTGAGTSGTTSVSGFAPSGQIALAQWPDGDNYYKARMCGVAGTGIGDIDPWCFAAAGKTDELAVSSAAGAVGAVKSAFSYLNNSQLFALLALTADGPWLGTNDDGNAMTKDNLISYLDSMYVLPKEYQNFVDNGSMDYLDAFAKVFGYGLINLDRATTPGKSIYFYDGNSIVSTSGNAYWRAATNTQFRPSSVFSLRGATIRAPFYDVLQSADAEMTLPRVWENEFMLGVSDERGLYMGDVLGEFKTRRDNVRRSQIGNIGLTMSFSERAYDDNMNGLDNLMLDYTMENWHFGASYQRYLTDGASRFDGMANPVLGLVSNAIVSDAVYKNGNWTFGARVFSGAITDEGLLENDPTISAQYMPATLGLMQGAQSGVTWSNDKFAFTTSIGLAHESDTILGAQTGGLLNLGDGDTTFVDAVAKYRVSDFIDLTARATFARTQSDASGQFILGMTDIDSDAFSVGANIGNFEFTISQPLAITDGALQYAYAEYDVVEMADNKYELNVVDTHVEDLSLKPQHRELRFSGAYRHKIGEFTDAAFGFIYRINPNHTDDFGNESIFMLKMSHRLGI